MELEVFQFTNDTLAQLKNIKKDLNICGDILDDFFFYLLENTCDGFFNISTRVKSSSSLKEKIIRHNYYLKYDTPEDLFSNLSDLIGVRIECRFIEDEDKIFKFIKSVFSLTNEEGFSFSSSNSNIFLDLRDKQPLRQQNGFKLYRIDGYINNDGLKANFELQIKSMVNTFWGEIEHKIIYKNYNMIFGDTFYKNILNSIKSNLSLIDNQLLTIYNHIDVSNNHSQHSFSKEGLERLLSKTIFDIYSFKIKNELGISIDFRNACDIVIDYIFSKNNCNTPEDYYQTFINTSIRMNEVYRNPISFKDKLFLEEYVEFQSNFSQVIGRKLSHAMNYDFHWNLFFKILFEIEPGNNTEDFISFIKYLEVIFYNRDSYLNMYLKFSKDEIEVIKEDLLSMVSTSFLDVDSIRFIYRDKLMDVFDTIDGYIEFLCENVSTFENYMECKKIYCRYLHLQILSIFNSKIPTESLNEFIKELKLYKTKLRISSKGMKYIASLDENSSVVVSNIIDYIYIR